MTGLDLGLENTNHNVNLDNGARFWVSISPQKNTVDVVKNWIVTFSQGSWKESITFKNPTKQIQTPNLSGEFNIIITKSDTSLNLARTVNIPALPPSKNIINCDSNCDLMVGIIAHEDSSFCSVNARFWTI